MAKTDNKDMDEPPLYSITRTVNYDFNPRYVFDKSLSTKPPYYFFEEVLAKERDKYYEARVKRYLKPQSHYDDIRRKQYKKKMDKIYRKAGPPWYQIMSKDQLKTLQTMSAYLKWDFLTGKPTRTAESLCRLGLWPRLPLVYVCRAMVNSNCRGVVFMWELTKYLFGFDPKVLQESYSYPARLMMSSIAYLDMEESMTELASRFKYEEVPVENVQAKKWRYYSRYKSPYLAPVVPPRLVGITWRKRARKVGLPLPDRNEILNRRNKKPICSIVSSVFIQLPVREQKSGTFDIKSKIDTTNETQIGDVDLTAGEPLNEQRSKPSSSAKKRPKYFRYGANKKQVTWKRPAKPNPPKPVSPGMGLQDVYYMISGIAQVGEQLVYIVNGVTTVENQHDILHGGVAIVESKPVPIILGVQKYSAADDLCSPLCYCSAWYSEVVDYINQTKCNCGHFYDFYNEGKLLEPNAYFHPPTRFGPYFFDYTRIFEMEEVKEKIRCCIADELGEDQGLTTDIMVNEMPQVESHYVGFNKILTITGQLKSVLQGMGEDGYLLGMLPQSYRIPLLKEWMRYRAKGELTDEQQRRISLRSRMDWSFWMNKISGVLSSDDRIPVPSSGYTLQEKEKLTWLHKDDVFQKMQGLRSKYALKFKRKILKFSREFWPSMDEEKFPSDPFKMAYATYMPMREQDIYMTRPNHARFYVNRARRKPNCPTGY